MANVNLEGLATNLTKEAMDTWNLIKDKLPNIQDFDKTPEKLLNLQGENADIIGALFKNSIAEAEYVCRNGRAITQCAAEISRVDRRVGSAILIGGTALGIGIYLWQKFNKQEQRINQLEQIVAGVAK